MMNASQRLLAGKVLGMRIRHSRPLSLSGPDCESGTAILGDFFGRPVISLDGKIRWIRLGRRMRSAHLFQQVLTWIIILSYLSVMLLVVRLQRHVDAEKFKEGANAKRFVRRPVFPPADLLTAAGLRMRKAVFALLGVVVAALIGLLVLDQLGR